MKPRAPTAMKAIAIRSERESASAPAPAASNATTGQSHARPNKYACNQAGPFSFVRQWAIQSNDQIESGTAYHGTSATPTTPTASQKAAARCDRVMRGLLHRRGGVL